MGPDGSVRVPLDEADVASRRRPRFRAAGVEAVAISYLHAYANPAHEIRTEAILREVLGDGVYITRGSEILPEIREYERTSTAVVNAYVGPVIRYYADALAGRLAAIGVTAPIEMMHSGGGIMRLAASVKRAASLVESGPAAGVIACARLVRDEGRGANIISFDMGGTTAKAALIENGEAARTDEYEVGAGINLSSKLVKGGGYPDQDAVHRRLGDRRRRRQHRRAGRAGPRHRRPRKRRRHARPGLPTAAAAPAPR